MTKFLHTQYIIFHLLSRQQCESFYVYPNLCNFASFDFCLFVLRDRVSLFSSGWPITFYVDQVSLELTEICCF